MSADGWTQADARELAAMRRAIEGAAIALRDIADAVLDASCHDHDEDARDDGEPYTCPAPRCGRELGHPDFCSAD